MSFHRAFAAGWRLFLSLCTAFIILTLFCTLYYNYSIHSPNENGSTDYKWVSNDFYSCCTEGFACGKTNNEGFINAIDYTDGMPIDILIMGSSHMEGCNVSQASSVTGQLSARLSEKTIYNIGVSRHHFLTCCANLSAALRRYAPRDYLIIETSLVAFTKEEINLVLDGTYPELADHSSGFLGFLSRNPFLRCVYAQLKGFLIQTEESGEESAEEIAPITEEYLSALDRLLSTVKETAEKAGTKVIVFYHPTTQVGSDNTLVLPNNDGYLSSFAETCEKNGICFLDMTDRFLAEYEENHVLPYGFSNTSVGGGHLNRYGHAMIADELIGLITSGKKGE